MTEEIVLHGGVANAGAVVRVGSSVLRPFQGRYDQATDIYHRL
jgi:hypothetical protein